MAEPKFKITSTAERNLLEITRYISQHNPAAAREMRQKIMESCALIGNYPHIGQLRADLTDKPVRFWPAHPNYMIVYRADTNPIQILRVYHSARDFGRIFH